MPRQRYSDGFRLVNNSAMFYDYYVIKFIRLIDTNFRF